MKLWVQSFGCQMNAADSKEMKSALEGLGFGYTDSQDEADAILINTCTVRQHAEDKAFSFVGSLRRWKQQNTDRLLIVAGCAAERTKEFLQARFPFIDLVVGAKSIEEFPRIIEEALRKKYDWMGENKGIWPNNGQTIHKNLPAHPEGQPPNDKTALVTAFVTIMRGCNYSCSYCIVPSVRGREVYRPAQTILDEIRQQTRQGVKEIMLLGQTVNSYGNKDHESRITNHEFTEKISDFSDLLRAVGALEGVERIRFMSPHPYYFSDKLIETLAETPQVCEHIHLPVQSGSNRILRLMRRNYTREGYIEIIHALKKTLPAIAITTDFIVGFPTETEDDFKDTMALMEEIGFNGAYCFKFSPRQGTQAAGLEGDLPSAIKEERLGRLLELTEKIGRQKALSHLGQTVEVLWESESEGKSRDNYRVKILETARSSEKPKRDRHQEKGQTPPGAHQSVRIEAVQNRILLGRIIGDGQGKAQALSCSDSGRGC